MTSTNWDVAQEINCNIKFNIVCPFSILQQQEGVCHFTSSIIRMNFNIKFFNYFTNWLSFVNIVRLHSEDKTINKIQFCNYLLPWEFPLYTNFVVLVICITYEKYGTVFEHPKSFLTQFHIQMKTAAKLHNLLWCWIKSNRPSLRIFPSGQKLLIQVTLELLKPFGV